MKFNSLLLLFCLLPLHLASAGNIALLDLTITNGVSASDQQMIADRLEMELIATRHFTVLERRKISSMLEEQGFQQSGACSGTECQVQMGQLLGVDQIVTGSLGKIGNVYSMNVKMIDVQSGAILSSYSVDVQGELSDVLTNGCKDLATRLARGGDSSTSLGRSNRIWWIAGGATLLAALGTGTYFLLQSDDSSTETVIRDRSIGQTP